MDIAVLGPMQLNGTSRGLSRRDRVILAALVAHRGESVSSEALADALWADSVPESWQKVIQGCVVRLRKLLGAHAIETTPGGYRLRVHAEQVDARRFEQLLSSAREQLALGDPDRAGYTLTHALALWRGPPLMDLEDWATGHAEAQRLDELRLEAEDLHTEAALRAGHQLEVLAQATSRLAEAPLRERRWALLARAQYQAGRQSDALATLRRARTMLATELGLDPGPELLALEAGILRQDPELNAPAAAPAPSDSCPYPGLLPFDVDDSSTFFGRDHDIAACLERLATARVLAVVGPSGSGKSSLVRAGIAAALRRDGRQVRVVTPGRHPIDSFVDLEPAQTILVVDQCEEALSEEVDPADRAAFVDALARHSESGELVIALRADRLGILAAHASLARLVERGLYLLGGMQESDLRAAIEQPARRAGLRLEPGLVDLLVREVEGEPGALPLLSHVLRQTWLRREGSVLTVDSYRASGGVREALARSAEGLYERLPSAQRPLLRDLMLRLVAPDPDGEPMRTRVPRAQVASDPDRLGLVEQLVQARLVSTDDQGVEIAHEALAREWPRLRAWLDDDVEGQRTLRHLSLSAESWANMGRPDSELYRGVRLARAVQWRATNPALSPLESAFLDASEQAAQSQRVAAEEQVRRERGTNRQLRRLLVAGAVALLVAVTSGLLALRSAGLAQSQAVAADARRVGAEALTAPHPDNALLLAVAGVRLDPTSDVTRANLMGVLDRVPQLRRARSDVPAAGAIGVNPKTGAVLLTEPPRGVIVYDPRTLRKLSAGPVGGGFAVAFSPTGNLIATADTRPNPAMGADPRPVRLLDGQGRPLHVQLGGMPAGFADYVGLAMSGDGRRVAALLISLYRDEAILMVWNVDHPGTPVASILLPPIYPTNVALSRDGRRAFTTGDGVLRIYDVATGRQQGAFTGPQLGLEPLPESSETLTPVVTVSPDGRTVAVFAKSQIGLLDASTFKLKEKLTGSGQVGDIAFSADGTRLAAVDSGVAVWDVASTPPVQLFRTASWGASLVALSPDGHLLYSAVMPDSALSQSGLLLAWSVSRGAGVVTQESPTLTAKPPLMARVSPDGRMIAYLENVGSLVEVRDVRSGSMLPPIRLADFNAPFSFDLAWRPDSKAVTEVMGGSQVSAFDVRRFESDSSMVVHGEGVVAAQYAADGELLIATTRGNLYLLDQGTLRQTRPPMRSPIGDIQGLEVSPDGHTVLITGTTSQALVDYQTGARIWPHFPYRGFFSRDGKVLAVVDGNGAVGFMDPSDAYRWLAMPDPSHPYGSAIGSFSRDGQWFASGRGGTVGLWSVKTGSFVGSVPAADQVAVGFTDDSSKVVIAGFDGSVRTWDISMRSWVDAACAMAGRELTVGEWNAALSERPYEKVCRGATS